MPSGSRGAGVSAAARLPYSKPLLALHGSNLSVHQVGCLTSMGPTVSGKRVGIGQVDPKEFWMLFFFGDGCGYVVRNVRSTFSGQMTLGLPSVPSLFKTWTQSKSENLESA